MTSRRRSFSGLSSTISALPIRPFKKKLHFDVTFTLQELVNCTLVTGILYAKIQLKDGGNFNGTSERNDVENHRVVWDQDFNFTCKMYVNASTGILEPSWCKISLRKESKGGKSYSKLGFVKINLSEFAGAGKKPGKYLLQSYNDTKHKPDNSLLRVKVYLRQTSGDIVFKAPETRSFDIVADEDEGFHDDWLSLYSRDHRASTGSTLSSYSTSTNTWSNASGSAGNLKSSTGDISSSRDKEDTLSTTPSELRTVRIKGGVVGGECDRESGSEETVVEQCPSQVTVDSSSTLPSHTHPLASNTLQSSLHSNPLTTPTTILAPPTPPMNSFDEISSLVSSGLSIKDGRQESSPSLPKLSPLLPSGLSSSASSSRRYKVGSSVQPSRVTAGSSSGGSFNLHRRQASMGGGGGTPATPSPLMGSAHKRHSSVSVLPHKDYLADVTSLNSTKTRVSVLSTLEHSRVDTESLVNHLIASHDLTPASDEEGQSNLKLYVDKHSGGVTLAGHDLDKTRFKEIYVHDESGEDPIPRPPRRKHRSNTNPSPSHTRHPPSSSSSSSTSSIPTPPTR